MSASWALQRAIYHRLSSDAGLTRLLGGPSIYDQPPQETSYPYLALGQSVVRDWSTGTETGEEHILTVHVWSRASGMRETQEIMGALRAALNDAALTVEGHRLINLRHEFSDARADPERDLHHGIVRYRAVTEPAG